MKLIIIISALFSFTTFANEHLLLNASEQQSLVREIDNICGDTWCEGDFNYSFDYINCNAKTGKCTMEYSAIWYDYQDDYDQEPIEIFYPYICHFEGIIKKSEIIEEGRWGVSYTEKMYDIATNCVDESYDGFVEYLKERGLW